jgi:hypothetical protein
MRVEVEDGHQTVDDFWKRHQNAALKSRQRLRVGGKEKAASWLVVTSALATTAPVQ